jgi:uncharacterized protein YjcR
VNHGNNPMHHSSICGARTRLGRLCKNPGMPNGRCRMHGGKSPGAPLGNKNALKHGLYSEELIALRRATRKLIRASAQLVDEVHGEVS